MRLRAFSSASRSSSSRRRTLFSAPIRFSSLAASAASLAARRHHLDHARRAGFAPSGVVRAASGADPSSTASSAGRSSCPHAASVRAAPTRSIAVAPGLSVTSGWLTDGASVQEPAGPGPGGAGRGGHDRRGAGAVSALRDRRSRRVRRSHRRRVRAPRGAARGGARDRGRADRPRLHRSGLGAAGAGGRGRCADQHPAVPSPGSRRGRVRATSCCSSARRARWCSTWPT